MSLEAVSFTPFMVGMSRRGVRFALPWSTTMLRAILAFCAALLAAAPTMAADQPTLTVYTYESFVGEYGPGQALKKAFEAQCGCNLAFVSAEDGGALYAKLKLEAASTKADVLLGIDD